MLMRNYNMYAHVGLLNEILKHLRHWSRREQKYVVPSAISSMFVFNRDVHDHDTSQANNIHVDPVHCDICIKCIRYQATTLYNCSDGINYNVSYQCFKYLIKNFLLNI